MLFTVCDTPIGPLLLAGDDHFLTRVEFHDGSSPPQAWRRDDARFAEECHQLQEYFAGKRTSFALPLRLEGSPFERRVWEALRAIPHGTTTTYGKLAATLGHATAARAVGAANGRNPVAVIVACHRVIGADGTLTGYAGGLERKRALLAHEAASARAGYAA